MITKKFTHVRWMRPILGIFTALALLGAMLVAKTPTVHATDVCGPIASNTTWTLAGSPYIVTCNVLVMEGVTLTIEPGVEVRFNADKALQIDGGLIAQGTSGSLITFTSNVGTSPGDWGYILFTDTSVDATYDGNGSYTGGSIIEHAVVEYAGGASVDNNGAVRIDAAGPFIKHSYISDNAATGVSAVNGSRLTIDQTTITRNTGTSFNGGGIYFASNEAMSVTNSTITYNSASWGGGLKITGWSGPGNVLLENNLIANNSAHYEGGGLYLYGDISVSKNMIYENTVGGGSVGRGGGIYVSGGSIINISDNIFMRNQAQTDGGQGGGIYLCGSNGTILRNVIYGNSAVSLSGGIYVQERTNVDIQYNSIVSNTSNDRSAISLNGDSNFIYNTIYGNISTRASNASSIFVYGWQPILNHNNILENNATFELYNNKSQGSPNLEATNNYWGTTDEPTIQDKIYDWFDDASKGIVAYNPYLTSPNTAAPISPPTGLAATPSVSAIDLNWSGNPESDLAGYKVYYDTDSGFPYNGTGATEGDSPIDVGNVNSFALTGLSPGTSYYIAITAYDADADGTDDQTDGNESWYSDEVSAIPGSPPPSLSIDDVTVVEGDAGTVDAVFTVSLSAASDQQVAVDYATADDTATAGSDYEVISGTLTFPALTTSQLITVVVNGDTLDELDETFFVNLSNPTNATIADGQGVGTIEDDDPPPSLSIDDVTVVEGDAGTVNAVFTVSLSAVSCQQVTVDYATADGTATAGEDYVAISGTLTFPAGTTTQNVTVVVNGDILDEGSHETFFVNLSSPSNATIADEQGVGTITDDDGVPSLSIDDVTVVEGDAGTVDAVFTVSLSAASDQQVTVDYASADGTATAGEDYVATSGTLTFPAGITTQNVTVLVNGDILDEPDETFHVNLSNATNSAIADGQGVGTISDDDPAPSLSIDDVTVIEGDAGTVDAVFTVSLSAASGQQVTVDYASADDTATAGSDYVAISGTVTFPAGTTTQNITVEVIGDTLYEQPDEIFYVNLSNATNADIGKGQGIGTIDDDDPLPQIRTLILTNKAKIESFYGASEASQLVSKLDELAEHSSVQGLVVQVENDLAVAAAYSQWDANNTTTRANAVTDAIKNLLDGLLTTYSDVEYIVLVGDDRVIPYRRVLDQTRYPESNYSCVSSSSTIGVALGDDMSLTDDFYADRVPTVPDNPGWDGHDLYIPDYALGRLIETPSEIIAIIDTFLSDSDVALGSAISAGYDFVKDGAQEMCDAFTADGIPADCTLISDSWSGSQFKSRVLGIRHGAISLNQHANHYLFGAPMGDPISASDFAGAGADLTRVVFYSVGCHASLNVPPGNPCQSLDLAQAIAQNSANYVANTGYGWGCRGSVCLSESLMLKFTEQLVKGQVATLGKALVRAKHDYYVTEHNFTVFDEKIMIEVWLLGLPMYSFTTPAAAASAQFTDVVEDAYFTTLANGLSKNSVTYQFPAFTSETTDDGVYYSLDGVVESTDGQPIQPKYTTNADFPGTTAHGVVFTGGQYGDIASFDPVVEQALTLTIASSVLVEPPFTALNWHPATFFRLNSLETLSGMTANLVAVLGQFNPDTGVERLYDEISFDVYYHTSSEDWATPTITSVSSAANGSATDITVGCTDASGIYKVVIAYTANDGSWHGADLAWDSGEGMWTSTIPITTPIEYFVQAIDNAGNVAGDDNNGAYYCALFGDFDGDVDVDVADIMEVANQWRMTSDDPDWEVRYDLDGDGIITVVDIMKVVAHWGETCDQAAHPRVIQSAAYHELD